MAAEKTSVLDHVHLDVASTHAQLEVVVERVQDFAAQHTDDEEMAYCLVLITSEAATNAMKHGNTFDEEKHVLVDLYAYADRFEVHVEDEGDGFNRADIADPLEEENLTSTGGRGLLLIETMADAVTLGKGGRRIGITLRRS